MSLRLSVAFSFALALLSPLAGRAQDALIVTSETPTFVLDTRLTPTDPSLGALIVQFESPRLTLDTRLSESVIPTGGTVAFDFGAFTLDTRMAEGITPRGSTVLFDYGVFTLDTRIPIVVSVTAPDVASLGTRWTLTSAVDDAGPFQYQWWKNGVAILGATGPDFTIDSVLPGDAGDYYVFVSGMFGSQASAPARLTVLIPPLFTQEPKTSTVVSGLGSVLHLDASASGTGPFSYQWLKDAVPIPGATSSILEIASPTAANTGSYSVRISNAGGTITSQPVPVQVLDKPSVTTPPQSQVADIGQRIELSVGVSGTGPFAYQWRHNGDNISGATAATYVIPSMRVVDGGTYTVAVINDAGAVTSDPAEVQVSGFTLVTSGDAFANATVLSGSNGRVRTDNRLAMREASEPAHAGKAGQHSIWFAWTAPANGQASLSTLGSSFDTLLGVYTGTRLDALTEVAGDDDHGTFFTSATVFNARSGQTYLIAVDGLGDASGTVALTWDLAAEAPPIPAITEQPSGVTAALGTAVTLRVTAVNAVAYQWRLNGVELPGATGAALALASLSRDQLGSYDVALSGGGATLLSDPVEVQIGSDTTVQATDKLWDRLRLASPGKAVGFHARSDFGSGAAARGFLNVPGQHQMSTVDASKDEGEPNHAGEAGGASQWFVVVPDSAGILEVTTDGSDFDTVLAAYTGPDNALGFGELMFVASDNNGGANGLTSRIVFPVTAGVSYFLAVDGVGGARGAVVLNYLLGLPPTIVQGPVPRTVRPGAAVQFSVQAENALPSTFQWRLNGVDIPSALSDTLTLLGVEARDAGAYSCVVKNFAGAVSSGEAALSVLPGEALEVVGMPEVVNGRLRLRVRGGDARALHLQVSHDLRGWADVSVTPAVEGLIEFDQVVSSGEGGNYFRITQ